MQRKSWSRAWRRPPRQSTGRPQGHVPHRQQWQCHCRRKMCIRDSPNAEEETVSEEEIRMMVDVGSQKGTIDHEEKQFIQNVFEFDDLTAGEIATHRTDLTILWLE